MIVCSVQGISFFFPGWNKIIPENKKTRLTISFNPLIFISTYVKCLFLLLPEIGCNLIHTSHLVDHERTAGIAVTALDTVGSCFIQRQIVFLCHLVTDFCQIIELVGSFRYPTPWDRVRSDCSRHIRLWPAAVRRYPRCRIQRLVRLIIVGKQPIYV